MWVAWQRCWVLWRKATLQTEAAASSMFLDVWAVLGCHTTHCTVMNPIFSVEKWANFSGNAEISQMRQTLVPWQDAVFTLGLSNLTPQYGRLHICWHHSSQHFALETPLLCFTIQKHVHFLASDSIFVCKWIVPYINPWFWYTEYVEVCLGGIEVEMCLQIIWQVLPGAWGRVHIKCIGQVQHILNFSQFVIMAPLIAYV